MNYRSNPELELADKFINNTGEHIFLTGKAGTGKTTFLRNLQINTKKKMIITAPTGVAAMNAGGVTLHSFFQIPFGDGISNIDLSFGTKHMRKEKIKIIKGIDLLVIDEISMVRADLLDAVDSILRRYRNRHRPFGGLQLLMIGDIRQLSPVIKNHEVESLSRNYSTPYFFSSNVWTKTSFVTVELKEIFRQSDQKFIELLNSVRDNKNVAETLTELNKQLNSSFLPKDEDGYVTLTTHNSQSDSINQKKLKAIKTALHNFDAQVSGDFPENIYPITRSLDLKVGAQVMFIRNDSNPEKRYFNGKIGQVVNLSDEKVEVKCKDDGTIVNVTPETWHNCDYSIDKETNSITKTIKGSFSQIPLKLAWAITIHKSQGLTFNRVIIDANKAFAHGQLYVALSRCRTLEGIVLSSSISRNSIIDDNSVSSFCYDCEQNTPTEQMLNLARKRYFMETIKELFNYDSILGNIKYIYTLINQHYSKQYRELLSACSQTSELIIHELQEVAFRFYKQLYALQIQCNEIETNEQISTRIAAALGYFKSKHDAIFKQFIKESKTEFDNKVVAKGYAETIVKFKENYALKKTLFELFTKETFSVDAYLKAKSNFELSIKEIEKVEKTKKLPTPIDVKYPELYEKLRVWRADKAKKKELPAYTILSQNAIKGISTSLPITRKELLKVSGVGETIIDKYGDEILSIVIEFGNSNNIIIQ